MPDAIAIRDQALADAEAKRARIAAARGDIAAVRAPRRQPLPVDAEAEVKGQHDYRKPKATAHVTPEAVDHIAQFLNAGGAVNTHAPAAAYGVGPAPKKPKSRLRAKAALPETPAAPVTRSRVVTPATEGGSITLAALCAELGIDGKKARIILRKKMTKPGAGWVFTAEDAATVRGWLKS